MRQGQFFIIGTILLTGLLLGAISLSGGAGVTGADDIGPQNALQHLVTEFPHAVASSLQEQRTSRNLQRDLKSFMTFMEYGSQQGREVESYFLVGIPTGQGLNATFGNFRGEPLQNVWIEIEGNATPLGTVDEQEIVTTQFRKVDKRISVRVNFTGHSFSFNTSKNVFSLIYGRIQSGDNVWKSYQIN